MNRKIIKYITCKDGCDISNIMGTLIGCFVLDDQVSRLLNKGWELYGSPYASDGGAFQAMVKYEQISDKIFEGAI